MNRRLNAPICGTALLVALLWSGAARADDESGREPALLTYKTPQAPHYFRTALEQLAIFGAGIGQYWYNKNQNSRDWQFKYDWPSLSQRLQGEAYSFDSNGFDTNFLFHPFSGFLYYSSARANHLGLFGSLAVAFTTSFLWEFFGEFQEQPSINDIIVTPYAGLAWSETTTQLGAFFLRSCASTTNEIIGSSLAPLVALHDAADGASRVHSDCRESSSWHRFRFALLGGEAWTEGAPPHPTLTASIHTEVIHLPGFARAGSGWSTFADGNVSELGLDLTSNEPRSPDITDVSFVTRTVLAGLRYRDNYELERREVLFGLVAGAEYSRHRYVPAAAPDRIFLLDVPAVTTRYYRHTADLGWELSLDAGGLFGAADAFALPRALHSGAVPDLTSVADAEGYNHVAGFGIRPRARLDLGPAEAGLDLQSERLFAFRALDRTGRVAGTPISELRRKASLWISFGAPRLERFLLSINWTRRAGSVGDVSVSHNELSLQAGIQLAP